MFATNRPRLLVAKFPKNARCAVTSSWDDNDRGNMEIARILDSLNLKGTFYIDFSNAKDQLSDSQIKTLSERHEVGSHTWSHADMRLSDERKIRRELIESRRHLEKIMGRPVLGLAYPYGHDSPLARKIARESGYLFARTTDLGHVDFPPSNPYSWGVSYYALKRSGRPKRILSRQTISKIALVYLVNLTSKSGDLAMKLFEKARQRQGVWHIYGHADEVQLPEHNSEFLNICRNVAGREDVWYTTNSMLFLNEIVKGRLHCSETQRDNRFLFRVSVRPPLETITTSTPMPLRLLDPAGSNTSFQVDVRSKRFEMGRSLGQLWVNIFANDAEIEVTH
jgi:peptidoglycan/xylan/chitin deacetylase (PgdA/CDA1 family)